MPTAETALMLADRFALVPLGVDLSWWRALVAPQNGLLAWCLLHYHHCHRDSLPSSMFFSVLRYPYDNETGFRLDQNCAFACPHRHFSHLLEALYTPL